MVRGEARIAVCKECSKRLYHERKEWGVCATCGKPRRNGETTVMCVHCLEKRAKMRQENREKINEYARARRQRFKAQGLCIDCGKPAIQGQTRCEYHKEYYAWTARKHHLGRKQKNDSYNG